MIMSYINGQTRHCRLLTAIVMTIALGLESCKSGNANHTQILTGYQPAPKIEPGAAATCERTGENQFVIKLMRPPELEAQKNPSWCWAVCAAALMNYDLPPGRTPVTQDDLVRQFAAHKSVQAADQTDILTAMDPAAAQRYVAALTAFKAKPHREGIIIVNAKNGYYEPDLPPYPNASCIVTELCKGKPVMVAIDPVGNSIGHIVVAVGVKCSAASNDVAFGSTNPYYIHDLFVIDPEDGKQTSYTAHQDQSVIDRIGFATSKPLATDYMVAATKAYRSAKWVPLKS
jgi:hypothetical protein